MTSNEKEQCKELLELLLSNRISQEERAKLLLLLDNEEGKAQIEQVMRENFERQRLDTEEDRYEDALLFFQQIKNGHQKTYPLQSVSGNNSGNKRSMVVRWTAAAAIAGGLIAGFLWMEKRAPEKQPVLATQSKRFKNDVQPGTNKATLTLSNGKTISLDDADNGMLASQGGTNVVKKANGEIDYVANGKGAQEEYNTITVPVSGQYKLTLADGTKVWLDALSSIHYPVSFTGKDREVEITGQAYFEVAKNPSQPFHVKVKNTVVEVLGTNFNINAYDNETAVRTTLSEGKVKVVESSKSVVLQPGQQCMSNNSTGYLKLAENVNMDEVLAWKDGVFHFDGSSVQTIMHQMERWYGVTVVYDDKVEGEFVAEIPRSVPLSEVLKLLELTKKVHFKINGKTISVTK
jgi:ferric-dicitrate binding protein FerR (iron transport regulator)